MEKIMGDTGDCLGDRMKRYEGTTHHHLLRRVPVLIRVDGRAFHTFTRGLDKPFDLGFMSAMVGAAQETAKQMQGFKVGYVQSDEVTFCLTDYETITTEPWFGYDLNKIVSISAALMSVHFNNKFSSNRAPIFDARAFNVPQNDAANAFLWRAKDWARNSIQMYACKHFSAKELHRKKQADMHNMLHTIGKNWTTDLSDMEKNGTFVTNDSVRHDVLPNYQEVSSIVDKYIFPVPVNMEPL